MSLTGRGNKRTEFLRTAADHRLREVARREVESAPFNVRGVTQRRDECDERSPLISQRCQRGIALRCLEDGHEQDAQGEADQ